jgi:plasmid stabilization system protein ParE
MPRAAWSPKRERQYKHIKSGLKREGRSEATAERIAAATVNRTRTAKGETKKRPSPTKRARAKRAASAASSRASRGLKSPLRPRKRAR